MHDDFYDNFITHCLSGRLFSGFFYLLKQECKIYINFTFKRFAALILSSGPAAWRCQAACLACFKLEQPLPHAVDF